MRKRLLLCLVFILLLATAVVPAMGGAPFEANGSTTIEAETDLPVIEVSVPTLGGAMINPNQLSVEVDAEIVNSQVLCAPAYIENHSEVPLRVSVEVTGAVWDTSNMSLSTVSLKGSTSTTKKAFLYFEFLAVTDPVNVAWASKYNSNKHIVVRNGGTRSIEDMLILGASSHDKRYGAFRLTGDCIAKPKNGWTADDGVSVMIVFTFSPLHINTKIP